MLVDNHIDGLYGVTGVFNGKHFLEIREPLRRHNLKSVVANKDVLNLGLSVLFQLPNLQRKSLIQ